MGYSLQNRHGFRGIRQIFLSLVSSHLLPGGSCHRWHARACFGCRAVLDMWVPIIGVTLTAASTRDFQGSQLDPFLISGSKEHVWK